MRNRGEEGKKKNDQGSDIPNHGTSHREAALVATQRGK
jgi:hypothetical protein